MPAYSLTNFCHSARHALLALFTACDRLALLQPILGLYGQMYAAKLSGMDNGVLETKAAKVSGVTGESDNLCDEPTAAEAAFSAKKLMTWLENPSNKARMYVRHA